MNRVAAVSQRQPLVPVITNSQRLTLRLAALCTVCIAVSGNPLQAHPTSAPLWGPTGLGTIPTTETVPARQAEVGLGYENVKPAFGRVRFVPVATATYGLGRGEIGGGYARERLSAPGFSLRTNYYTLHGKYRVYESRRGSAVAVGAHYLDFGSGNGALTSLYAAGSHDFLRKADGVTKARGHLGLIYQRTSGAVLNTSEIRPMVGVEYFATSALAIAADYIPRKDLVARTVSLALRYQAPSGLGAQIGVGKLQNDTKIFVGATYRFGGPKRSPTEESTTTAQNAEVQR